MRNFKKFLALFLSGLMLFACTKESMDLASTSPKATARSNNNGVDRGPMANLPLPYYSNIQAALDNDFGTDPADIFGTTVATKMQAALDQEQTDLDAIGFNAYTQKRVVDGEITAAAGSMITFFYNEAQKETEIDLGLLEAQMIGNYGQSIPTINGNPNELDYLYIYAYLTALDLVERYKNGQVAIPRGTCSFAEAVEKVFEEMIKGAKIGKLFGDIIYEIGQSTEGELGVFFTVVGGSAKLTGIVYGAIIGTMIGVIKSIFFAEECD